jgi:hypothetical protein
MFVSDLRQVHGFLCPSGWRKQLWFMVFNATFNNISAISWLSVLLVEEIGVAREKHGPVASHRST